MVWFEESSELSEFNKQRLFGRKFDQVLDGLRHRESLGITPEYLHDFGLSEVGRIQSEILDILEDIVRQYIAGEKAG